MSTVCVITVHSYIKKAELTFSILLVYALVVMPICEYIYVHCADCWNATNSHLTQKVPPTTVSVAVETRFLLARPNTTFWARTRTREFDDGEWYAPYTACTASNNTSQQHIYGVGGGGGTASAGS